MPPQRIFPPLHKMILVRKVQKFTLNALPLTYIERRQTLCNRTSIVLIRMNKQHGRCPVASVARGIMFVVFGLVGPEGAVEVSGEG